MFEVNIDLNKTGLENRRITAWSMWRRQKDIRNTEADVKLLVPFFLILKFMKFFITNITFNTDFLDFFFNSRKTGKVFQKPLTNGFLHYIEFQLSLKVCRKSLIFIFFF